MSRTYTHKMVWETNKTKYEVKIHKTDTIEKVINEFKELYDCCHTVSYQKYPLRENDKIYLKRNRTSL